MMHPQWLDHLNRLRTYLGWPEHRDNDDGTLHIELDETTRLEFAAGNWNCSTAGVILHTWDVSYHNGDFFNHQTSVISATDAWERLLKLRRELEAKARIKVKHELEQKAVTHAMQNKGLLIDDRSISPFA